MTEVFSPLLFSRLRNNSINVNIAPYNTDFTWYSGTVAEPWHISSTLNQSGTIYGASVQYMEDVVTPKFRKLISEGKIINNPMNQVSEIWKPSQVPVNVELIDRYGTSPNYFYTGVTAHGTSFLGNFNASGNFVLPAIPLADTSVIAAAIADAWARVSFNEAQALVQAAEFHKTVGSLFSILRRVVKICNDLSHFRLKAVMGQVTPKQLSNRYMEARYALRPLMYDMRGTIRALQGVHENCTRQTFRGFKKNIVSVAASDVLLKTEGSYALRGSTLSTRTLEVRAGVLTSIDTDLGIKLNSWGVDEPFQAIWELIPFSFIVDWFCNIGKVIAAWSPKFIFKTLASWYVVTDTICQASTVETGTPNNNHNYRNICERFGSYSKVTVQKYRLPNPDRPLLPSVNIRVDGWKTLDLGIILNQLFKITHLF